MVCSCSLYRHREGKAFYTHTRATKLSLTQRHKLQSERRQKPAGRVQLCHQGHGFVGQADEQGLTSQHLRCMYNVQMCGCQLGYVCPNRDAGAGSALQQIT